MQMSESSARVGMHSYVIVSSTNKCKIIPENIASKHLGVGGTAVLKRPFHVNCAADSIGISTWDLVKLHLLHSKEASQAAS